MFRKAFIGILFVLSVLLILTCTCAFAAHFPEDSISPCYTYTESITASLSFDGNYAICSGSITPSFTHDTSIVVTLYQLVETRWVSIGSWTGSSSNGLKASAGGRCLVANSGTFKVTTTGNVGGLESPSKSITRVK